MSAICVASYQLNDLACALWYLSHSRPLECGVEGHPDCSGVCTNQEVCSFLDLILYTAMFTMRGKLSDVTYSQCVFRFVALRGISIAIYLLLFFCVRLVTNFFQCYLNSYLKLIDCVFFVQVSHYLSVIIYEF